MPRPEYPPRDPIPSPCLGVCVIDARNRACYGCFRTPEEIGAWPGATEDEKRTILTAIAARRKEAGLPAMKGQG